MKNTLAWSLLFVSVAAAAESARVEVPLLPRQEYRTPLEEVIVLGSEPYWRQQPAPRWDKPKVEIPLRAAPARLQWIPPYAREEREDYNGVRDQLNPQPRLKLFEIHF